MAAVTLQLSLSNTIDGLPVVVVESLAVPPHGRRAGYWYRIGHSHMQMIIAADEDAARAAILARHPHARGQRLVLTLWEP